MPETDPNRARAALFAAGYNVTGAPDAQVLAFYNNIYDTPIGGAVQFFNPTTLDPATARTFLSSRGIDTSSLTDQQAIDLYNRAGAVLAIGSAGADAAGAVADALNPLNWKILGLEIKYWLLIGGGLLIINTLKH